jgi:hypothetical protein
MYKEKILELIKKYPKHYTKKIQGDPTLWQWVAEHSLVDVANAREAIYSAISGTSNICDSGKIKKLGSISTGWYNCGPAAKCECTRLQVAQSVSEKKATRSAEQILNENNKRQLTNIKKYGVDNIGKIENAKNAHKAFYQDKEKVAAAVEKQNNSMLSKHGPNYSKIMVNKRRETCLSKYGVDNPMKDPTIFEKASLSRALTYDPVASIKKNHSKFVRMLRSNFRVTTNLTEEEYIGVASRPMMTFTCCDCGHEFNKRFDYAVPPICKICNPTEKKFKSGEENAVCDYIASIYQGKILQGDRSIINPFELDIVLPEKKLAIEYCGLYWHSEVSGFKEWNYHANKMRMAESRGYRLLTIFSDEWLDKQDIVKSKLQSIIAGTSDKIGARKCQIMDVDYQQAVEFHNLYHIQGSPRRLGKNIGLFYQGVLVALGSFITVTKTAELVRFSSKITVVGGAGKILNYFIKNSDCNDIISFADMRWSQGNLYKSLGFVEVSRVPAMQMYVKDHIQRFHKLAFPKKKINPEGIDKTEWQIMREAGYDRIWDCGKQKWQLDVGQLRNKQ